MATVTRPRGPLPPRVYWTRRLLVAAVALGLVFALAHLLGGGTGTGTPSARPVGAVAPSQATGSATGSTAGPAAGPVSNPAAGPGAQASGKKAAKPRAKKTKLPLPMPTGPCVDNDVRVTPSVDETAYAGRDVRITLNLTAADSPACTWEVSSGSVVVKLTSGTDRIWSTQDCPGAVQRQSVIVRQGHPTKAYVVWNGQRSDSECSRTTPWAQPGYYHAEAAALGSEPADRQFRLATPPRPTITPSPTSDAGPAKKKTR